MKLRDVHILYKFGVAIVVLIAFVLTYHEQFVTKVEAKDFATVTMLKEHNTAQAVQTEVIVTDLNAIKTTLHDMSSGYITRQAYAAITNIEGDIKRHNQIKVNNPVWLQISEKHLSKLKRAISYKDCIVAGRINCDNIR